MVIASCHERRIWVNNNEIDTPFSRYKTPARVRPRHQLFNSSTEVNMKLVKSERFQRSHSDFYVIVPTFYWKVSVSFVIVCYRRSLGRCCRCSVQLQAGIQATHLLRTGLLQTSLLCSSLLCSSLLCSSLLCPSLLCPSLPRTRLLCPSIQG